MTVLEPVRIGSARIKALLAVVGGAHTVSGVADRIGRNKSTAYSHLQGLRRAGLVAWPTGRQGERASQGAIHATVGPVSLSALRLREPDPEAPCESLSATTRTPPSTE